MGLLTWKMGTHMCPCDIPPPLRATRAGWDLGTAGEHTNQRTKGTTVTSSYAPVPSVFPSLPRGPERVIAVEGDIFFFKSGASCV